MNSAQVPPREAPSHAFVDESKRKGFSLIRCDVPLTDVDAIRSDLRALLRPGQRRIHFYKESPATRSAVLRVIANYDVRTVVYTSTRPETIARRDCITAMLRETGQNDIRVLSIELDRTQREHDKRSMQPMKALLREDLLWRHMLASTEPGLWIPDAIGWCLDHPTRRWRNAIADLQMTRIDVENMV